MNEDGHGETRAVYNNSGHCIESKRCAGLAEPGSNGMVFDHDAETIYVCQHGARRIAQWDPGEPRKPAAPVVETYNGITLNSPNDITLDPKHRGRLFFTDPPYGLLQKAKFYDGTHLDSDPAHEQPHNGVYEFRRDTKALTLLDKLHRPNGIAVTPDGEYLLVSECCQGLYRRDCEQGTVKLHQYSLNTPIRKIRTLTANLDGNSVGCLDGFAVDDRSGLVVSSCPLGLCILSIPPDSAGGLSTKLTVLAYMKVSDYPVRISNMVFADDDGWVTVERSNMGYATISLSKEPVNSMDKELWHRVHAAFVACEEDDTIRGVIFTSGYRDVLHTGSVLKYGCVVGSGSRRTSSLLDWI